MACIIEEFGTLSDGRSVSKITISNEDAFASFLTFGAIFHSFSSYGRNVVVSLNNAKDYENVSAGKVIGPFANRISNACFSIDGKEFHLDKNNGRNNIHSGSANIGNHIWDIEAFDENSVTFHTKHKEGDGGIPGNMDFNVKYSLVKRTLRIDYVVSSDADSIINPTNHVFFNLNKDNKPILNHQVEIDASCFIDVDSESLPQKIVSVNGSDFDFTSFHSIGERRNGIYDNCFIFGKSHECRLKVADLMLIARTDRPAIQLYTGKSLSFPDTSRGAIGPFGGVALETSGYIDAVNHPEFESAFIKNGEVFKTWTEYEIRK